jgi:hypothetical protein
MASRKDAKIRNGIGEKLDDFLKEDGIYDEVKELAAKKLEDFKLQEKKEKGKQRPKKK